MYLSAPGLVCSVGMGAEAACAAMRAGIAQFEELPYRDNNGEAIIGAAVPGLDPDLSRAERLVEMLALALAETLGKTQLDALENVPLIVCLAEPDRPGGGAHLAHGIIGALERKLKVNFHPSKSGAIATGHTAGFRALRAVRQLLQDPDIPACLVCGVDSYINASSLLWLDRHWRLKTEENSDGAIPGEAAGAIVLLCKPSHQDTAAAAIAGIGFGHEDAGVLSDEPLLGKGLADAAGQALAEAGVGMHDIGFRTSDVSGESYGFREVALTEARHMRVRREELLPLWHCAENTGDTGAVAGISQMVVVHHAFKNGYAPGGIALCHASAVSSERAAAVFRVANPA